LLTHLRSSLTYANVMATVAVFVALGGTSYALATGSIDSRELKNNSIRSKDIRNNDVLSKDVRNRSLLARDFKVGQLPKGDTGPRGQQGSPGISGLKVVSAQTAASSESPQEATATCPAGKRVIGASGEIVGGGSLTETDVAINDVVPSDETEVPGSVLVRAIEVDPTAPDWSVVAFAICANVS
jgi:hypothetical protein